MVKPIAIVGGVDLSTKFKGMEVTGQGPNVIGRGDLYFDEPEFGLTIDPMMEVKVYIPFNDAGEGVKARGRLFMGFVANRTVGNTGRTTMWQVTCQDVNLLLDTIIRDAAPAYAITITADDFAGQVLQAVQILQFNGSGTVHTQIDAISQVPNLYTGTMPELQLEPGHSLRWYLQQVFNSAIVLDPALDPQMFMGTGEDFGALEVFGGPVLHIYDGALEPAPDYTFDESNIYGEFSLNSESTLLTQRQQSIYGEGFVATYADTGSQALYPNNYINHGRPDDTGYWMSLPLADTESANLTEAGAAIEATVKAKSYPRDTISFQTYEYVRPGDVIDLTWDLAGISGASQRVVGVTYVMDGLDLLATVTANDRRLGLGETGTEGSGAIERGSGGGSSSTGGVFKQDGNAFGENAVLGTLDDQDLNIITNGDTVATFRAGGGLFLEDAAVSGQAAFAWDRTYLTGLGGPTWGIVGNAYRTSSAAGTSPLIGAAIYAGTELPSGTVDEVMGINAGAGAGTGGTTTNLTGLDANVFANSGATVTNAYGVRVRSAETDTGGAIGTAYGIYVQSQAGAGIGVAWAGYFNGDVNITGDLTVGGSFGGGATTRWEPLTNGDPVSPEIMFDSFGDVMMIEVPL